MDQRIEMMFANGFLDEVKSLLAKGYSPSLPTMSAIGYRECIRVIKGELSEEQAKAEIKRLKEEKGEEWLYEQLQGLDEEADAKIDPRNVRRTIRAIAGHYDHRQKILRATRSNRILLFILSPLV